MADEMLGRRRSRYNWIGLVGMLIVAAICLLFLLPAALSGNLLFSADVVRGAPVQIALYYRGQSFIYEPGDPEYDLLLEAANATLVHETGFYEGFGWREERFDQARREGVAVELLYAEPVKVPGRRVDIADPIRLFFPLEVFGHEGELVFRGGRTEYWGLPIRVDTLDRLRDAVDQVVNG